MHVQDLRGIERGDDVAVETRKGAAHHVPAIPQCTARSKRFVFGNDTHVKRSVCCLEMGLDLVDAVTTRHNDFIHHIGGKRTNHVLKQGLVENREQWLGYGVGPRPEP